MLVSGRVNGRTSPHEVTLPFTLPIEFSRPLNPPNVVDGPGQSQKMRKNQVERETFCLFGLNCLAFCGVFVCVPKKGSACFFLSTLSPYRANIHGHHDGYFLGMCIEAAPFQNDVSILLGTCSISIATPCFWR